MTTNKEQELRAALRTLLDSVDYMTGACRSSEQVGAVLPSVVIVNAKKALDASEDRQDPERGDQDDARRGQRPGTGEPEAPKNVGYAKAWVSGPLRVTDQLFPPETTKFAFDRADALGSFTLCLYWREQVDVSSGTKVYWVDFELFEVRGARADAVLEYQRRGAVVMDDAVTDLSEAEVAAAGFVKWDGCTQLQVADVHVDHRSELRRLTWAVSEARRRCALIMMWSDVAVEYAAD